MKIIRKISVGSDYPNGCIHYQVGKELNVNGQIFTLTHILLEEVENGKKGYNLYIQGENSGSAVWKTVIDMPVHIENDVTFL